MKTKQQKLSKMIHKEKITWGGEFDQQHHKIRKQIFLSVHRTSVSRTNQVSNVSGSGAPGGREMEGERKDKIYEGVVAKTLAY
jgi:hypothetical protein